MERIFQRIAGNRFSELDGLRVNASVPVPQRLINEIIQTALHGNRHIEYGVVTILGENQVLISLKATLWPWPLDLRLRLDKRITMAGSPKITAALENGRLLGKWGSLFKVLPAWIDINKDQLIIDTSAFLTPEQQHYLGLIKLAEIRTEPGRAILDVKIRID